MEARPYYQEIVETKHMKQPDSWDYIDFNSFAGDDIELFDFQQEAVKYTLRLLDRYFGYKQTHKSSQDAKRELSDDLNKISGDKVTSNKELQIRRKNLSTKGIDTHIRSLMERYEMQKEQKYGYEYGYFPYHNFANRAGLWMATGSGKSVVGIKMVEVLDELSSMDNKIPEKDFLLLAPRDDILEQFHELIDQYNRYNEKKIELHSVRDYNSVKNGEYISSYNDSINLFYYRSDNITDETKQNELSFEDIDNGGNWYVLLDEAHKGDSSSSKKQDYFSMLSRNGFLFNLSATFTDPIDICTTVYNYNVKKFTGEDKYGKNVLLSNQELDKVTDDEDDLEEESKRKIVLKSLITLTSQKMAKNELDELEQFDYHEPLLTAFVNSVNTTDSDLDMFFDEMEKIAKEEDKDIFERARQELENEINKKKRYVYSEKEDPEWVRIDQIDKQDVLNHVFNSETHSNIELRYSSDNKKEVVFKMKSSSEPFALVKIGSGSDWIKRKRKEHNAVEDFDFGSYFEQLESKGQSINILLGSRSFYEGWDVNRPNVMMFINLGVSTDSQKFIMQSLGRGLRIEPSKGKRKRARFVNNLEADVDFYPQIKTIETLMVFGTKKSILKKIIETVKDIENVNYRNVEGINKNIDDNKKYLAPTYKPERIEDVKELPKFSGNRGQINEFVEWIDSDKILMCKLGISSLDRLERLKQFIESGQFTGEKSQHILRELNQLNRHVESERMIRDGFESADGKIVHFENIKARKEEDKFKIENKIDELKDGREKNIEDMKDSLIEEIGDFDEESAEVLGEDVIEQMAEGMFDKNNGQVTLDDYKGGDPVLEKIDSHYYNPLIRTRGVNTDIADVLRHIVKVASEYDFIEDLVENGDDTFSEADWWMWSKIEENVDDIYIPYQGDKRFQPDFMFWVKVGNRYQIIFVDPKSTSFAQGYTKIDGYEESFMKNGEPIVFDKEGMKISVHLRMYTNESLSSIPSKYRDWWIDSVTKLEDILE